MLAAFFRDNLDGQRRAGFSFMPRPDVDGHTQSGQAVASVEELAESDQGVNAFGSILVEALMGGVRAGGESEGFGAAAANPSLQIAAARVLHVMLRRNVDGKIMLFRIPLAFPFSQANSSGQLQKVRLVDKFVDLLFATQHTYHATSSLALRLLQKVQVSAPAFGAYIMHVFLFIVLSSCSSPSYYPVDFAGLVVRVAARVPRADGANLQHAKLPPLPPWSGLDTRPATLFHLFLF